MTIEEIRTHLKQWSELVSVSTDTIPPDLQVDTVIDSIVQIRGDAYNQGWDDAKDES